jgi:hypothetical protein
MKTKFVVVALVSFVWVATALQAQTTATPVITVPTGSYAMPITTTLTDSTSGASFLWCWVTTGTCIPATAYTTSSIYIDPPSALTICVNATATGYGVSSTVCHTYTNSGTSAAVGNNTFPTSGNVGIGTTSPADILDVDGNLVFGSGESRMSTGSDSFGVNRRVATGAIYTSSEYAYQLQHTGSSASGSDYLAWQVYTPSGVQVTPDALVVNSSGNVGIGTTNPAATLDIGGNLHMAGSVVGFNSTGQGAYISWNQLNNGGIGETDLINNLGLGTGGFAFMTTSPSAGNHLTPIMFLNNSGWLGIETLQPQYPLDVGGIIHTTGGVMYPDGTTQSTAFSTVLCGGDYAESVDVSGDRTNYEPGDVLVIDPSAPGKFLKANDAYSPLVAGIYSTKPGLVGRRQTTDRRSSTSEVPMAMVGIVPTKVSAENGPIKLGDLLVASSTLGRAMKGTDRSLLTGTVIGKALGALDSGTGIIDVLVSLQ